MRAEFGEAFGGCCNGGFHFGIDVFDPAEPWAEGNLCAAQAFVEVPARSRLARNGCWYQSLASGSADDVQKQRAVGHACATSGPTCAKVVNGLAGQAATRPKVGFKPNTPQKLAGMRIEPPASVPIASGQ